MLTDKERRQIIEADPSTFLSHTHSVDGGRFAKINKEIVIGAKPVPNYPTQPSGSFSNQGAVVPPEEPLGFSVEEVPVVGEPHEVNADLVRPNAFCSLSDVGDGEVSPASAASPADGLPTSLGGQRFGSSLASNNSQPTPRRRKL